MFLRNWARLYSKQTPAEVRCEGHLCKLGVPYRTQHPFFGLRRIADFVLPGEKVVIEVDGASHNTPAQRYKDVVSTIALEEIGWRVVRFTNDELLDGLVIDRDLLELRLAARPTLRALREQLRQAAASEPPPKPRKRSPKPAPRSRKGRKGRTYEPPSPGTLCH